VTASESGKERAVTVSEFGRQPLLPLSGGAAIAAKIKMN
jgi:hypothetical protein